MLSEQARALEAALWSATRALEERAVLLKRLAARAQECGATGIEERFREQGDYLEQNASLIRDLFINTHPNTTDLPAFDGCDG
jgi:hypothetical protein